MIDVRSLLAEFKATLDSMTEAELTHEADKAFHDSCNSYLLDENTERRYIEMPRVLRLTDGEVVTVFNAREFEWLIDKYMGYDAALYFRELMDEIESEKKEIRSVQSHIAGQMLDLISKVNLVGESARQLREIYLDWSKKHGKNE